MPRDPLAEAAGEKLDAVFNKARKLITAHFPKMNQNTDGYRISTIAYMKMIVKLMELSAVLGEIPAPIAPGSREEAALGGEAAKIPDIDIAVLGACDWRTYWKDKDGKTKPAKPHQAGWVKNPREFPGWENPPKVLFEMAKALDTASDHKLVLGDLEYSFSGEGKFISRRPVKQESAKDNPGPQDRMSQNLQNVKDAGKELTEGGGTAD